MALTEREEKLWIEIESWEQQFFNYEPTDFEMTYQKWLQTGLLQLGEKKQEKLLDFVDNVLFHLHALIQNSRFNEDSRNRLLSQARVFNGEITDILDMKKLSIEQLNYIASQQMAKQRLFSFGQGGLSGMGGVLLLGIDLPAMLAINMRAIQQIALTYGYDLKHPSEMMIALKVFHASSLPKDLQHQAWNQLFDDVATEQEEWFYGGSEEVTDISWLQQPIRQMLKALGIVMLRKKLIQGVPLIGMAFGATMNYQFTRQVTEVAHHFYQKRFLLDKASNGIINYE
ncbi:EcsC family protein [Bacillus sp. FJAT-45350]|uniref:EcsC family protein n=1 Tax=Bacillus sp. FJAT-45350 TaxID=2011014 RepID=UPI000BB8C831|nr:EcsC family protein [Bacillus sp. FJAT-45350]